MFALVLTGLVGIFSSVENARMPAGPTAAAGSMPAPDETKATVGNDESGTNRFCVVITSQSWSRGSAVAMCNAYVHLLPYGMSVCVCGVLSHFSMYPGTHSISMAVSRSRLYAQQQQGSTYVVPVQSTAQ